MVAISEIAFIPREEKTPPLVSARVAPKESIDDCLTLAHKCAVSSLEYAGGVAGQLRDRNNASNLAV